ncbi:MAG: hypothetical protein HZR80_17335 [Candidatus Heimdallarchaeota archaeon]
MVNHKAITVTVGGLILTLLGGIFAFFYNRGNPNVSTWPIIAIVGLFTIVGVFVLLFVKKRKTKDSLITHSSSQLVNIDYTESKHQTCFWCGYPLDMHSEFCSDCGKRKLRCIVCKLPISFGDDVGKCSLCESIGHFTHLFEWIKTKGFCPHCLRNIPTQAIISASDIK